MKEVLPGVRHWTARHPKIGIQVSSYWLPEERVLLDPLLPRGGLHALRPAPEHAILTNRHHYRACGALAERFGCAVWCVEEGLHEFTHGEPVQGFRFGDILPGGIEALEVGVLCPDEGAFLVPKGGGALAIADGVIRDGAGPLRFVTDDLLGDDPTAVKTGLKASYRRLLEREFDHLLLAHGEPWIGGAKAALRAFVEA